MGSIDAFNPLVMGSFDAFNPCLRLPDERGMNSLYEKERPLDPPHDVELYTSPWVSGTRAAAYFGPISSELFLADGAVEDRSEAWEKAERELLESLRDKARALGANAVVGLEVTLDPFAHVDGSDRTGLRLHAVGTAAKLEPLF
jgi:uncharacterized protein YbjQ (UPF0145 family)